MAICTILRTYRDVLVGNKASAVFINILNLKVSKCYVWSTHSQCRVKILNIAQMAITFLLLHILV